MKKIFAIVFAVIAFSVGTTTVTAAQAKSKVATAASSTASDWFVYESMWIAGGLKYQAAVHRLASVYSKKMNKHCNVPRFDVTAAAKEYAAVTPRGAEVIRDEFIRKQIATLSCITMYGERHATAERLM